MPWAQGQAVFEDIVQERMSHDLSLFIPDAFADL